MTFEGRQHALGQFRRPHGPAFYRAKRAAGGHSTERDVLPVGASEASNALGTIASSASPPSAPDEARRALQRGDAGRARAAAPRARVCLRQTLALRARASGGGETRRPRRRQVQQVSRRDRLERTTRAGISSPEARTAPETASPDRSSRATWQRLPVRPHACRLGRAGNCSGERRHAAPRARRRTLQPAHLLRRAPGKGARARRGGRYAARHRVESERRLHRLGFECGVEIGGGSRRAQAAQFVGRPGGAPSSHHGARWARAKAKSSRRKSTTAPRRAANRARCCAQRRGRRGQARAVFLRRASRSAGYHGQRI